MPGKANGYEKRLAEVSPGHGRTMNCRRFLAIALASVSFGAWAQPLVAIDVGHSLANPGAISARGRPEFSFNLELAGQLRQALEAHGLAVLPVNFDGRIASLAARPEAAAGSALFVSVHHDAVSERWLLPWAWNGQPQTYTEAKRGFGLFVSRQNPLPETSLRCASAMGAMLRRAGFAPSAWHGLKHDPADADNGVWFYDNLVVLYRTTLPAVLVEAGVIKHRDEELELLDPARQARMADALATGVAACLSVPGNQATDSAGKTD